MPSRPDDAWRSFQTRTLTSVAQPVTIADGLRASLSQRTFELICSHVDDILTVPEQALVPAMRTLWTHLRVIVEVSSAVPYAALQGRSVDFKGARVALILSGGNVDLDALPWSNASA